MVECLDKDELEFCDGYIVSCFDEGVVVCLDKNNKDDFGVDFLLAYPLEYIFEETLSGQDLVQHGYLKKIHCSDTYVQFCHDHNYKILTI